MLDIGWTELLVIAVILIVVVGPKDLPAMLRAFGKTTANLRRMAGDFRTQFDEALKESELDEVRNTIADAKRLNPTNALRDAINPLRQMGQDIRSDLQKATQLPTPAVNPTDLEAQKAIEGASPVTGDPASGPAAGDETVAAQSSSMPAETPALSKKPADGQPAAADSKPAATSTAVSEPTASKPARRARAAAKTSSGKAVAKTAAAKTDKPAPGAARKTPAKARSKASPASTGDGVKKAVAKAPARKRATTKTDTPKDDA